MYKKKVGLPDLRRNSHTRKETTTSDTFQGRTKSTCDGDKSFHGVKKKEGLPECHV